MNISWEILKELSLLYGDSFYLLETRKFQIEVTRLLNDN